MTVTDLKKYIYENNKIEYILESIGCHHIKPHCSGKYYTCANKDGDNYTAISLYNDEFLTCMNYTRQMTKNNTGHDLITLVCFNMNMTFSEANKYLHQLLGLEFKFGKKEKQTEKIDPLQIFKKVKKKKYIINSEDLELYDEGLIKEYIPLPWIGWVREGILPFTCDKFKIGYSVDRKRIIIPERYWCGNENDYLGIMGRTTVEAYEMLGINKYFPLKAFTKSMNIYGLQENYKSIQAAGYVCVAESQKSVLKRHSRKDETVVSIGSHNVSDEQVRILIGLDVDIIICMDKDVSLHHIRSMCERFYGLRNIYYMYDNYGILKNKESPMDLHYKKYNYMFKYKIKYNEKEHTEYLKEEERNKK